MAWEVKRAVVQERLLVYDEEGTGGKPKQLVDSWADGYQKLKGTVTGLNKQRLELWGGNISEQESEVVDNEDDLPPMQWGTEGEEE